MNFFGAIFPGKEVGGRENGERGRERGREERRKFRIRNALAVCAVAMSPHPRKVLLFVPTAPCLQVPVSHTIFVSCCARGAPHKRKAQSD
jgi:hypothetical protein